MKSYGIAIVVMKATEARLAALAPAKYKVMDAVGESKEVVFLGDVEKIRRDLFLAILELEAES